MDSQITHQKEPISLASLQQLMSNLGFKALLVRGTDRYFNEYVPKEQSIRTKLTGFDGSLGDALITSNSAHLFVDGRYSLQAKTQAQGFNVHVCENAQSIENTWLKQLDKLLKAKDVLAYDPSTVDIGLFDRMSDQINKLDAKLEPKAADLYEEILGKPESSFMNATIEQIDTSLTGLSCQQKLAILAESLKKRGIDGFLVVKLDDIAWMTNLRSYVFAYQSAVPGIACLLPDRIIFGTSLTHPPITPQKGLEIVKEHEVFEAIKKIFAGSKLSLGIDSHETSKAHELALRAFKIELKQVDNPICGEKAIKNEKELLHMRSAFKKADQVVFNTQKYVVDQCEKKKAISEGDVDDYVKNQFKISGAKELSFRPICASGKNGAIIHYGTMDREQAIREGSLFLLDTGAYYQAGYATDLTRTFLAAPKSHKAKPWQKEMFTLVLQASIRGLSARLKKGSLGIQLDAIVRAPLWQAGLDYAHGTGHGVGINVHEFPPRVSPVSEAALLAGQIFSIEPGLYFKDLGGVRIENLATIVEDPDHKDFIRVLPLTFCPLDERLIEEKMLTSFEKDFLSYLQKEWENDAPWPKLPPLSSANFADAIDR